MNEFMSVSISLAYGAGFMDENWLYDQPHAVGYPWLFLIED